MYDQVTMNSVTDYIDTIAFFAFSMYYCSSLYVLTPFTRVTVCVICHAEIKDYLLTYLLTVTGITIHKNIFASNDRTKKEKYVRSAAV